MLGQGYRACIENAQDLMRAAHQQLRERPAYALALAQIGQEEVGKSWHLLTAFALPATPGAWRQFWRDWRDHNRKAQAAFFYEWLHPRRFEITAPDGRTLDGMPVRTPIAREKEVGLYVDFDEPKGLFVRPTDQVESVEAQARTFTLMALGLTAAAVFDTAMASDPAFAFPVLGEIATTICTGPFTPQEAVPAILDEVASRSPQHETLIGALQAEFLADLEDIKAMEHWVKERSAGT